MDYATTAYNKALEYPVVTVALICLIIIVIIVCLYRGTTWKFPGREKLENLETEMQRLIGEILSKQSKNMAEISSQ